MSFELLLYVSIFLTYMLIAGAQDKGFNVIAQYLELGCDVSTTLYAFTFTLDVKISMLLHHFTCYSLFISYMLLVLCFYYHYHKYIKLIVHILY